MSKTKRSLGINYPALEKKSEILGYGTSSIASASTVLFMSFDKPSLTFKELVSSFDFPTIFNYCLVTVRRFCKNVNNELRILLSLVRQLENPSPSEELFAITIVITHKIASNDPINNEIKTVFPSFSEDIKIVEKKISEFDFIDLSNIFHNEEKKLTQEFLFELYKESQMKYWIVLVEKERYSEVPNLIMMVIKGKLPMPEPYLQKAFVLSIGVINEIIQSAKKQPELYMSNQNVFSIFMGSSEFLSRFVSEILPNLSRSQVFGCGIYYSSILYQLLFEVNTLKAPLDLLISFISVHGDSFLLENIKNSHQIGEEFTRLFLSSFEQLFQNSDWLSLIDGSNQFLEYLGNTFYPLISLERKKLCPQISSSILYALIQKSNLDQIIKFFVGLSHDFLIALLTQSDVLAQKVQDMFSDSYESIIQSKEMRAFIIESHNLLRIILYECLPKSQFDDLSICSDLYQIYLQQLISFEPSVIQSIPDFVKSLFEAPPAPFLTFSNLSPSIQIIIFEFVTKSLKPNEIGYYSQLFFEFFRPLLTQRSLLLVFPQNLRKTFYNSIVLKLYLNNTIGLSPQDLYDLTYALIENPYNESDKSDFYSFLSQNVTSLLPNFENNRQYLNQCYDFISKVGKPFSQKIEREFALSIIIMAFIRLSNVETNALRLFSIYYDNNFYINNVSPESKLSILVKLSEIYRKRSDIVLDNGPSRALAEEPVQFIELISGDPTFSNHLNLVLTKDNRSFLIILSILFSRDKCWPMLLRTTDFFLKFVTLAIDSIGINARNLIFIPKRYDDLFQFFCRSSPAISQNDTIRIAFLQYFLSMPDSLPQVYQLVPLPSHHASFFTELSDSSKNSVISQFIQGFFERPPANIPISTIFSMYLLTLSLSFISLKNHDTIINSIRQVFTAPDQAEFDAAFNHNKQKDLETGLYRLRNIIGLTKYLDFISVFQNKNPGPENCFKQVSENVIKIASNDVLEEVQTIDASFENPNPQITKFTKKPDMFLEFTQALCAFTLVFYLSTIAYSSEATVTTSCAILASICFCIVTFVPMYFSSLNQPGDTLWFYIQWILDLFAFSFLFIVYYFSSNRTLNTSLLILGIIWEIISIYMLVTRRNGIPESLFEEEEVLVIN